MHRYYSNLQSLLNSTVITRFLRNYSILQSLLNSTAITQIYSYYSNLHMHNTAITQIFTCIIQLLLKCWARPRSMAPCSMAPRAMGRIARPVARALQARHRRCPAVPPQERAPACPPIRRTVTVRHRGGIVMATRPMERTAA